MISYKKEDAVEHVKKMKALFAGDMKDRILIDFCIPPAQSTAKFFPDITKMFDAEMYNHEIRKQFVDDFFRSNHPFYGNPHSGFMGGEVDSSGHTIWSQPIDNLYNCLDVVKYNENNPWLAKFIHAMEYYKQHKPDDFLISSPVSEGTDDIAEALRGPDFYYDFYDCPGDLKKLLKRCADFALCFHHRMLELVDHIDDGYLCWEGWWTPDDCISMTSDSSTNYSAEMFEEFIIPMINYTVDKAGGKCWMHVEGSAIHIIDSLKKVNGLMLLQYTNNPKRARGIAMMDVLRSKFRELPLKLLISKQEFYDGIREKTLIGNCIYDVGYDAENLDEYVKTPEEASEIMSMARTYRAKI